MLTTIAVVLLGLIGAACSSPASHAATAGSTASTTTPRLAGSEPRVAPKQRPSAGTVPAGPRARVQYSVVTHDPVVFVTIDDGFTRDPRVIAFIRAHHWPISAFVIDRLAKFAPSYFRQLLAAGATLNDHTYTHPDLATLNYAAQQAEICRATRDFPRLFGEKPRLFRPPYGSYNDGTRRAAEVCGFTTLVAWNATMQHGVFREAIKRPLHRGDIILLHFTPNALLGP
jgi:peptidoglycan/xylan/chitin deacetylase (PgdA/CDA1 family)